MNTNIVVIIVTIIVFAALQMLLYNKAKNKLIKYLPICVIVIGLFLSLITYMGAFNTSPSVVASNSWLAIIFLAILGIALIGCLIGILLSKIIKKLK